LRALRDRLLSFFDVRATQFVRAQHRFEKPIQPGAFLRVMAGS
jgi:hypothetical protein